MTCGVVLLFGVSCRGGEPVADSGCPEGPYSYLVVPNRWNVIQRATISPSAPAAWDGALAEVYPWGKISLYRPYGENGVADLPLWLDAPALEFSVTYKESTWGQRYTLEVVGGLPDDDWHTLVFQPDVCAAELQLRSLTWPRTAGVEALVGEVYRVRPDFGRVVNVPQFFDYRTPDDPELLLHVVDANQEGVSVRAGWRRGEGQDFCAATVDFSRTWQGDVPRLVHEDMPFGLFRGQAAGPLRLELLFDPNTGGTAWMELSGFMDVRRGQPLWDPDTWCDLTSGSSSWAGGCQPCPTDGRAYCQSLQLMALVLSPTNALSALEPIEQDNCHPDCPASADNPDCDLAAL